MSELFPYGLDAPPVVRNLALAAGALWLVFALSFTDWLPIRVEGMQWPAMGVSFGALAMVWSSRVGKLQRREQLLDQLTWRGDETVVDVGCGRGLFVVAAARRVPHGKAVGIDIWQSEDLSGNGPDAVAANARREGVADRVSTRTEDMRKLTFADASVDVIVSSVAIHNLYAPADRDKAIDEIARVLRPGGQLLIDDIRHLPQYASRLALGGVETTLTRGIGSVFWTLISFGSLRPGTVLGRKRV